MEEKNTEKKISELRFTADGKEYTLAFTRETMIQTEGMGFVLAEVYEKPMTAVTQLWRGAFFAHHGTLTFAERDALLERVDNHKLLDTLIDLYNAPIESLFDEENSKNAIKWTVT